MSVSTAIHINSRQIDCIGSIASAHNNLRYSEWGKSIKNEKRIFGMGLPKSQQMRYKRIYELKKLGYVKTIQAKQFQSFVFIKLTEKALNLLIAIPIFFNFLSGYLESKEELKLYTLKHIILEKKSLPISQIPSDLRRYIPDLIKLKYAQVKNTENETIIEFNGD